MDSRGARGAVRDPQAGCPAWRTADRPRGCGAGVSCGGGHSSVLLGSPGTVGEASHWTPTGPSRCRKCPGPSCSWTQGQGLGPSVWARDGAGLWGRFSGNREGDVVGPALCPLSWEPSQSQADRDRWSRGGRGPRLGRDRTPSHVLPGHGKAAPEQARPAPGRGVGLQLYSREAGNLSPDAQVQGAMPGRKEQLACALGQTSAGGRAAARWAQWARRAAPRLDAGGIRPGTGESCRLDREPARAFTPRMQEVLGHRWLWPPTASWPPRPGSVQG